LTVLDKGLYLGIVPLDEDGMVSAADRKEAIFVPVNGEYNYVGVAIAVKLGHDLVARQVKQLDFAN
jgi:hypothetical protein